MKISDRHEVIVIFAIYWMNNKTYFYGMSKGYTGLLAYDASEVEIIDSTLSGEFIYLDNGIFYKPLIVNKLLDDLVEGLPDAYHQFIEILKKNGHIDPDFC
ncbi:MULTISPECIES: hypothetical protein [Tenebrionibacter/Tenebrionicola group]|jgi:hypothetical protein|uniref:Uncharacterized protein n=2 Tax=Tenebrionibacter/Tenebrionicola group TaxID=2969848 RepID=A0A8K0XYY6_9ENTR|nr:MULTISPECIES: hypothetical protein [Tenebrionibacter/Tenebrionicola group]MBK4717168.1 hypothetical protein [Tenebrionibacter intestinalis]MBV5097674.1 hypothetical protein [Tenebrionicola larvae]